MHTHRTNLVLGKDEIILDQTRFIRSIHTDYIIHGPEPETVDIRI